MNLELGIERIVDSRCLTFLCFKKNGLGLHAFIISNSKFIIRN